MNKTIHINLSGQVFTIDENAYEELSAYINDLKNIYAREVGLDDIISDIEARFAEVFSQKLEKSNRQIVSLTDVQEVITAMGRPEEFEGDRDTHAASAYQKTYKGPKRLYRDPDDQVIAGVSSGLAAYFNVKDPVWIRIAFILLAWFGGGGLLIYIILWLVLPVAKTATQKLEMRGESVTLSNLEKSLREGIDTASSNIKDFTTRTDTGNALNRGVNFIGRVVGKILYVLMLIIKWAFVFFVGVLLFSAVAALIGMLIATVAGMPIANLVFFENATQATLSTIGLLLFLAIPLIILIYLPLRLFFKWRVRSNIVGLSLLAGWIVGIFLLVFVGVDVAGSMSKEYQQKNVHTMAVPDTLYLAMNKLNEPGDFENVNFNDLKYLKKKKTWVLENIELDVVENTDTAQIELVQHNFARGKDRDIAKQYAQHIQYNVRTEGDSILFDDVLRFGAPKKFRGQKVRLTLKVPNNTVVIFGNGLEYIVDDVPLSTYEGAQDDATVYVPT